MQLIACLTRENVVRLDEVLDYGLELGVGFCFQLLSGKELDKDSADRSLPDQKDLIDALEYLLRLRQQRHPRAKAIASHNSELRYYLDLLKNGSRGCQCTLVTATMMPDGRLIFCGNAKQYDSFDAVRPGFADAFGRLTIPDCDGCVCVGKLRLSRVYRWDWGLIKEMAGLWR